MFLPIHDDNPVRRFPIVTIGLIAINAVAFLYTVQLDPYQRLRLAYEHGFVPKRVEQLTNPQPLKVDLARALPDQRFAAAFLQGRDRFVVLKPDRGEILLSLVTCMFLHGSWMHLIGNMWFLWLYGNNIEDRLGPILFTVFYLIGGIFASLCHWSMTTGDGLGIPVIGASGAVAVVLGSYAVTYPQANVRCLIFLFIFITIVELPALVVLGFWMFTQVINGLTQLNLDISGGVAWWAHIGGFLFGLVIMPMLAAGTPEPDEDWKRETDEQFDFTRPQSDRRDQPPGSMW